MCPCLPIRLPANGLLWLTHVFFTIMKCNPLYLSIYLSLYLYLSLLLSLLLSLSLSLFLSFSPLIMHPALSVYLSIYLSYLIYKISPNLHIFCLFFVLPQCFILFQIPLLYNSFSLLLLSVFVYRYLSISQDGYFHFIIISFFFFYDTYLLSSCYPLFLPLQAVFPNLLFLISFFSVFCFILSYFSFSLRIIRLALYNTFVLNLLFCEEWATFYNSMWN